MTENAGWWVGTLPDASLKSMAEAERQDHREEQQAEAERADKAAAAENRAFARNLAGHEPRTVAEVLSARQGILADRIPKALRGPLDAEVIDAPVRRTRRYRDGDVITRALLAREARRVDRPAREAAEALEASRARRRRPQTTEYADVWAAWRENW